MKQQEEIPKTILKFNTYKTYIPFQYEELTFEIIEHNDLKDLRALALAVGKFQDGSNFEPYFNRVLEEFKEEKRIPIKIVDDDIIGFIDLKISVIHRTVIINNLWFDADARMCNGLFSILFDKLKIRRICSYVDVEDLYLRNVYQNLGFKEEFVMRNYLTIKDVPKDYVVTAMIDSEWKVQIDYDGSLDGVTFLSEVVEKKYTDEDGDGQESTHKKDIKKEHTHKKDAKKDLATIGYSKDEWLYNADNIDYVDWKTDLKIESDRLLLVKTDLSKHAKGLYETIAKDDRNKDLWTWLWNKHPTSPQDIIDIPWFQVLESYQKYKLGFGLVIILKETGKPIGMINFLAMLDSKLYRASEIGYIWVAKQYQRSFVTSEANYLATKYAFDNFGINRMFWKTNNKNVGSKKCALRLGYKYEGLAMQELIQHQKNRDTPYYSITKKDWEDTVQKHLHHLSYEKYV